MFDFGNMNHLVEEHNGKLWVYVQKNAKMVTIMRKGYTTIDKYDLHTTIEAGKTYVMQLSAQGPVIYTQMVMFQTEPKITGAVVMVQREGTDGAKELFGTTDATGGVAKSMEYGTYTYEVMAENYYPSEGRFTLNNQNETHREDVMLRSNGANITLSVDADADIFVNNNKKGTRSWTGSLKAGSYQVECRQANHKSSSQNITVKEGEDQNIALTPPTPITGVLALSSTPLGAGIKIDGKDYGTTPRNVTDLLIGQHTVTLSLGGYNDAQSTVEIKEQQNTDLSLPLTKTTVSATPSVSGTPSTSGGHTFTVKGVSFEMVLVEGGTFQMGNNFGLSDESPEHAVTLDSYYIGQTEVTQALWYAVMGNNPSKFKGGKFPVESVKWKECLEFISRLNQVTGKTFRLPTEAEWEYAARGGNKSKGYQYSGSNNIDAVAWYGGNSGSKTHEVATKQPNELGIYDMSGNVWEWCQDRYKSKYYSSSPSNNPPGSSSGSFRVIRGGSWGGQLAEEGNGDCSRVSRRAVDYPFARQMNLGFRLALSE